MSLLLNRFNKWAFIHVPKTGGTSLNHVLKKDTNTEVITGHDSIRILNDVGDYYIFTIVRNPFTRLASAYNAECRKYGFKEFGTFIKDINENDSWYLPQVFYINAGKHETRKVTYIGKYENYEQSVSTIFSRLDINDNIPHLNRNPIYDKEPNLNQQKYYSFLYNEDWMLDWVRERYKDDFKIFNYGMDIPR